VGFFQLLQDAGRLGPRPDFVPLLLKSGGVALRQAGCQRGFGDQRLVRPIGAAAISELEVLRTPFPPGRLAARDAVPDRPRVEQARQEIEQDRPV
jgi:hypothetical protein